jgi:hypothetical protein
MKFWLNTVSHSISNIILSSFLWIFCHSSYLDIRFQSHMHKGGHTTNKKKPLHFSPSDSARPGDLGTRKRPGTSCKIEIHFWFKITLYLINSIRFLSKICPRYSFPCGRHRHKVSKSFTKESGRDKWLKVRNWISILLLVPVLLLTVRSPGMQEISDLKFGPPRIVTSQIIKSPPKKIKNPPSPKKLCDATADAGKRV